MQIQYLQKKRYHFPLDDANEYPERVRERESKLSMYRKLAYEKCCQKTALEAIGISRATYYRWNKAYKKHGIEGLVPQSKIPHTYRKPLWTASLERQVVKLRKKYSVWGKAKLTVILKRDYGVITSESTVGRILKKLVLFGRVRPVWVCNGGARPTKKRVFNNHAKRWKYGMRSGNPGELVQIDHMVVEDSHNRELRQFAAICPKTKIIFEQVYTRATAACAADFLQQVRAAFPFPILSVQVDGGCEFMAEFETSCRNANIPLFVLPPRRPQYNGCVERSHGTCRNEFYAQCSNLDNLAIIRTKLQEYVSFYNTFRPHQSLCYQTPWQFWQHFEAQKSHML